MSFKNIASKEKKEVQIKSVQLSGSVAMKILQHCTESDNAGACGQLLGLDVSTILEVTECFPFLVWPPTTSNCFLTGGFRLCLYVT